MAQNTFTDDIDATQTGFEDTLTSHAPKSTQTGFSLRTLFDFPLFHWKSFFLFLGCCCGVGINWLLTAEIFEMPYEVQKSRIESFIARDHYARNRSFWLSKERDFVKQLNQEIGRKNSKEALDLLQKIEPETLLAFLITSLHVDETRFSDFTIMPQKSQGILRLMLSKFERGIWPLKVMLTLELEINVKSGHLTISFARLRRGAKDVSRGLAWAYFGAELEPLRNHELFQLPLS